jgi:hypothetical protein
VFETPIFEHEMRKPQGCGRSPVLTAKRPGRIHAQGRSC